MTNARPLGMSLPQTVWIKLSCLRTGVGRSYSSKHKWGLTPSPNCECGASEQTADHVIISCPIHRAPHRVRGLTVLDDKICCWLSQTLFGNPKGPVELGNPNTCAETKLCLNFILFRLKK